MLTAKGEETDIVTGLELGADDYIPKPFGIKEMIARVKTVLRRIAGPESKNRIIAGDLMIDPEKYQVIWKDTSLDLTFTEFKLLFFLAQRKGRVLTRGQLLDGVLGEDAFVTERTVDVHIRRLREKLNEASSYIVTRRGVGYMFCSPGLTQEK
jgi:two-component system phosphate regulon response regulator PhoB